ncbi:bile acid:sodium symporter family protein [Allomuricauda sp. d1]|uniref:bile acid:sodium symporter family protein n=1 Tax=Allomuricauda sp. d1 TaxID=3136725 RepID=UPI0031D4CF7F
METVIDNVHINFDPQSLWTLNIALALVMFGVALEISIGDFRQLLQSPKLVLTGVFSQFIMLPAVTFLMVWFFEPLPSIALGMLMVAACPGGNISNFMTHLAKGNTALSVTLTAIATLLAIVMTPFNLEFWGSLYPPTSRIIQQVSISFFEMAKLVALLLGLPVILGMWLNHAKPIIAKKMAKYFKMGSLLFFAALIFLALYQNRDIFLEYVVYVFGLVVVHNLVAFSTGFSLAKLLGFSKENVRSITIETGIQNSGLGLLLIFTFFDGLGGMALLTAFWGIWHLVSGLALGSYWGLAFAKKEKFV